MTDETAFFALDAASAASASALSRTQLRFLEAVATNPRWLERASFPGLWEPSPLFPSALQPWPTFVARTKWDVVARDVDRLAKLVESTLRRWIESDFGAIDGYFRHRYTRQLLELGRRTSSQMRAFRADLVETKDGFRCIELNVGGALGGWELGITGTRQQACSIVDDFWRTLPAAPKLHHPFARACGAFEVTARKRDGAIIFVGGARLDAARRDFFELGLRALVEEALGAPLRVPLHFRRPQDAQLLSGRVVFEGVDARTAVVVDAGDPPETPPFLQLAEDPEVDFFSGPLGLLLSDKRCLALLWDDAERGDLRQEDVVFLERFLPRTARITSPDDVALHGAPADRLVLKPGDQFGGKDVTMSAECTEADWAATAGRAAAEGSWVVQHRVDGIARPLQHGERGVTLHRVVWGCFILDGRSGGLYLRVMPVDRGLVVNVSRGGESALAYEVEELGEGDGPTDVAG